MIEENFPQSISGKRYRLRLEHPQIEEIAKRLEVVYQSGRLQPDTASELLAIYQRLAQVSVYFLNILGCEPIPATAIRPTRPDDSQRISSRFHGYPDWEVRAGFVFFVADRAAELEAAADGAI